MNGTPIAGAELERAVAEVASERRIRISDAERAHLLERIIDEELLVQRAVEIGLPRSDRAVRAALVAAMLEAIVAEAESAPTSDAELRAFHARHPGDFARPGRLRVQRIFFRSGPDALERAERVWTRLEAGEAFPALREAAGDPDPAALPDALLPPGKLRDYLGAGLTQRALELAPGAHSRPIRGPDGVSVLRAVEVEAGRTPTFEEVRDRVEAELRRRTGEQAVRAYLEELRQMAEIRRMAALPERAEDFTRR